MKESIDRAKKILKEWKGDSYTCGEDVLEATGKYVRQYGGRITLVVTELGQAWIEHPLERVKSSLKSKGVIFETISGARPNAPREDVYRISLQVARAKSEMVVALGGGSTVDAAKAAAVLNTYSPEEVMEILGAGRGDADSIASMTACLLAAFRPETLPCEWIDKVRQKNNIDMDTLAERLTRLRLRR